MYIVKIFIYFSGISRKLLALTAILLGASRKFRKCHLFQNLPKSSYQLLINPLSHIIPRQHRPMNLSGANGCYSSHRARFLPWLVSERRFV